MAPFLSLALIIICGKEFTVIHRRQYSCMKIPDYKYSHNLKNPNEDLISNLEIQMKTQFQIENCLK